MYLQPIQQRDIIWPILAYYSRCIKVCLQTHFLFLQRKYPSKSHLDLVQFANSHSYKNNVLLFWHVIENPFPSTGDAREWIWGLTACQTLPLNYSFYCNICCRLLPGWFLIFWFSLKPWCSLMSFQTSCNQLLSPNKVQAKSWSRD